MTKQIVKPNVKAVKEVGKTKIEEAQKVAEEAIKEANLKYSQEKSEVSLESDKKLEAVEQEYEEQITNQDARIDLAVQSVSDAQSEIERLQALLKEAKKQKKERQAALKVTKIIVKDNKKTLAKEFEQKAWDLDTERYEAQEKAYGKAFKVISEANDAVEEVKSKVSKEISEERSKMRAYRVWKAKDNIVRTKDGFVELGTNVKEIFNRGYENSEGAKPPAKLDAAETSANDNDKGAENKKKNNNNNGPKAKFG